MIIGILVIIASLKISKDEHLFKAPHYLEIEGTIRAMDKSIEEADEAVENLNKLSQSVFDELEKKYQEILFLYSLMDEKKKDITEIYSKPMPVAPQTTKSKEAVAEAPQNKESAPQEDSKPAMPLASAIKNPNLKQILKLRDEGMDVAEIAKTLDIGQGEVQLILGLGKR